MASNVEGLAGLVDVAVGGDDRVREADVGVEQRGAGAPDRGAGQPRHVDEPSVTRFRSSINAVRMSCPNEAEGTLPDEADTPGERPPTRR
jgi:hypothetical protein